MDTAFSGLEASSNPFALMVDGGSVVAAMQRSERLNALARKVVRLLGEADSDSDGAQAKALDD